MGRLIIDGMNVIGSRPDGWWRDRDAAVRRLLGQLQRLAAASPQSVTLVLDGRPLPDLAEGDHGGVTVRYAERGHSADDRIVAMVAADPDPASLEVVTADRGLRERVGECGAGVSGPGGLLARLR
ncbi:MAG TPA: NYN domain-containing protein [Egibacteraceae bacterium]|nr:NYN domain-containing protein [Actinomycetota bacterium]HWB73207.1 NYN domain-containing protein [Egibacteraceae bacterium]